MFQRCAPRCPCSPHAANENPATRVGGRRATERFALQLTETILQAATQRFHLLGATAISSRGGISLRIFGQQLFLSIRLRKIPFAGNRWLAGHPTGTQPRGEGPPRDEGGLRICTSPLHLDSSFGCDGRNRVSCAAVAPRGALERTLPGRPSEEPAEPDVGGNQPQVPRAPANGLTEQRRCRVAGLPTTGLIRPRSCPYDSDASLIRTPRIKRLAPLGTPRAQDPGSSKSPSSGTPAGLSVG
jgi:hypothetical protein